MSWVWCRPCLLASCSERGTRVQSAQCSTWGTPSHCGAQLGACPAACPCLPTCAAPSPTKAHVTQPHTSPPRQVDLGEVLEAHAGIAHTRWATHGPPTAINAHPHVSGPGHEFVVVHNGIITNFRVLKNFLVGGCGCLLSWRGEPVEGRSSLRCCWSWL